MASRLALFLVLVFAFLAPRESHAASRPFFPTPSASAPAPGEHIDGRRPEGAAPRASSRASAGSRDARTPGRREHELSTALGGAPSRGGLPGAPEETFHDVRGSVLGVLQSNHLQSGVTPILTRYAYDPLEELLSVTDAKGNVTSAQYDTVGRMIALTSPDAGLTTYNYDLSGNLAARQTAKLRALSQSIQYSYDFNRLKQITYPTSPAVKYFYGDPGDLFNAAGRVREEDSEAGVKTYEYDTLGNVAVQRWTLNSIAHDKTYAESIGYDYDAFGRLLTIHFPDNETVSYGYDAGGNVTAAVGVDSLADTTPYLLHVGSDEFGQRTRMVTGNGVETTYAYDLLTRRLSSIDASTFQALRYKYDLSGNIDQIQNLAPIGANGQVAFGPSTQNFTYDDLYQLKTADGVYQESAKNGTFNYGLSLTYDTIGNIVQKDQTSTDGHGHPVKGQQYSSTYTYGSARPHAPTEVDETPVSPNKPLARLMAYDPSGNLVQNDTRSIDWNEEDRITAVHDNGKETLEALYDGSGDRAVKLRADGGNHETLYFGPNMTSRDGEAPSKHIFVGTQRIASKQAPADHGNQAPEVFYFHDDHLGSTQFMTNSEAELAAHEEYFPTGELWVDDTSDPLHVQTPYLFTGKELDTETGLYYFGARYYDPHLGIWASPDPATHDFMLEREDLRESVYRPQELASYTYALNNPLRFLDPGGRQVEAVVEPVVVVVVAGGAIYYSSPRVRKATQGFVGGLFGAASSLQRSVERAKERAERKLIEEAPLILTAKRGKEGTAATPSAGGASTAPATPQTEKEKHAGRGVPESALGGSGKPRRHNVELPSRKAAQDAARRAGEGRPMGHRNPRRGRPHFHATDKGGNKIPGTHYNYPK